MPTFGEQVELSFSAAKLKKKDILSQSDAMLVVGIVEVEGAEAKEVGRTEVIKNSASPVWMTKMVVEYNFHARQMLVLSVYDWDHKGDARTAVLNKKDLIGTVGLSLGQLMSAGGKGNCELPKKCGTITVSAETVILSNEAFCLTYSASDLDKKDVFGKSDPFLVFSRQNSDETFTKVFKSETIKNSLNPVWAPMVLPVTLLCGGDENRVLKIECFDADDNGKHDLIGECLTSAAQMRYGPSDVNTQALINPKKVGKKKYVNSGVLKMMDMGSREELGFLHHIRKGAQIHFTMGVDFSSANGDPKELSSLHHIRQGEDNEYMAAIRAVGEVVQDYDSDGMFPALGMAGKLADGRVSQGFYMNGSADDPNCKGVQGLLKAYWNSVHSITPHHPTNFSPIINYVTANAAKKNNGKNYHIILFITKGGISDLEATKRALVNASEEAVSVIIVGVGGGDFSAMRELDADRRRLSFEGKFAKRDIVQFVQLRDFTSPGAPVSPEARAALAGAVLEELPGQFMEWQRAREAK